MLISPAYATAGMASGFDFAGFMPLIIIIALFWFLILRPQQKRAREHKQMLAALAKDDEVLTQGGLIGRITKLDDRVMAIEIALGVEIQLQRSAVTEKLEKGTYKPL